jgi:hypothetical protein
MLSVLGDIFKVFMPDQELSDFKELASGHINDTFLVITKQQGDYILQKINKGVFGDVPGLISNKVKISQHLHQKLNFLSKEERERRILTFLATSTGAYYFVDANGDYWNATIFIDNSQTFETVTDPKVAYEGGKLFGEFIRLTQDFDPSQLVEVIPRFHDMSFRFEQFEDALKIASDERKKRAKIQIDLAKDLKDEMHILQNLKDKGDIRSRVTHNDTKISNALFDMQGNGLCVIDTDTIMPGIIHYDFGDAIRTICNTAAEDEKNLDKVKFSKDFYEAYSKGFLEKIGSSISELERKYLPLGAKSMMFIMALRFLTDYLNGDIYYKTKYPEHNLDRSKNQFKLIQSFEEVMGDVS